MGKVVYLLKTPYRDRTTHVVFDPLDFIARQTEKSAIERHATITWAQRLQRVFNIDVETCVRCGNAVRVIASIEEPALIGRILTRVRVKGEKSRASLGPPSTGPPVSA